MNKLIIVTNWHASCGICWDSVYRHLLYKKFFGTWPLYVSPI